MPLADGKFSPNFDLAQFEFSQTALMRKIDNRAYEAARKNLYDLAWTMETVRAYLGGNAILITSGYRSPALNEAVGGSNKSDHTSGHACDFVCPGFGSPLEICRSLEPVIEAIGIGQLIFEAVPGRDGRPREWVHLSIHPNRSPLLTIDGKGTRVGIHEARE